MNLKNRRLYAIGLPRRLNQGRMLLLSFGLPMLVALSFIGVLDSVRKWALFLIGFGAVIFFHELGHFLAAKFFKIRCDVFALGIGTRLCGWRKGVGFSFGATRIGPLTDDSPDAPGSGPAKKIGETDYRLSWLPFGGYVRMLGQDDMDPGKVSDDPASYGRKPIWQRMIVISAGVIMNLIFAAVLFAYIFRVGVMFQPAQVGGVVYGSPAQKAGLQVGDRIISINHRRPLGFLEFSDLATAAALDGPGQPVSLQYLRGDSSMVRSLNVTPVLSPDSGLQSFGVYAPYSLHLVSLTQDQRAQLPAHSPFRTASLNGATIRRVNGQVVNNYGQLYRLIQQSDGKPMVLTVSEAKYPHVLRQVTLQPTLTSLADANDFPAIFGMYPVARIEAIIPGDPAEKVGLKPGDQVLQVANIRYPTTTQFRHYLHTHEDLPVSLTVRRGNRTLHFKPAPIQQHGHGFLGVAIGYDFSRPQVGAVTPEAEKLGIKPGAVMTAISGSMAQTPVAITNWFDLVNCLRRSTGGDIKLNFAGSNPPVVWRLTSLNLAPLHQMEYVLDLPLAPLMQLQRSGSWPVAVVMGVDHTRRWILRTYLTLRGIGVGTISPHQLHSVLVIAKVGYEVQSRGFTYLLFFLGVISVNLAVINFLPLPILDGGVFLMLILEKFRGRPLPLKVQSAIQFVGIALLGAVFLYITVFNDLPMLFK